MSLVPSTLSNTAFLASRQNPPACELLDNPLIIGRVWLPNPPVQALPQREAPDLRLQ